MDFNPLQTGIQDSPITRPAGPQEWGPWEIFPPEEPIGPIMKMTGQHRCHVLWQVPTDIMVGSTELFFPDKILDIGE